MDKPNIQQQETLKRFHSIPKSDSQHKPSEKMRKTMKCRSRIQLIEMAKGLGCTVEELAQ